MKILKWLVVLVIGFALIGALTNHDKSSPPDSNAQPDFSDAVPAPPPPPSVTPTPKSARPPGYLSRKRMGKANWPLTVRHGVVRCEGTAGAGLVIFRTNGVDYAVNGTAQTVRPDMPTINKIWRRPDSYGLRISMGPIIDKGLSLC